MRRLLLFVLLLAVPPSPAAATIRGYDVRIQVADSGTADVEVVVSLEDASGTVGLPAGFATVTDLALVSGPAGTTVTAGPSGKQTLLLVRVPPSAPSSITLVLRFGTTLVLNDGAAPAAPRQLRHALLNTQPDPIETYTAHVVLPHGTRAHIVREVLPAPRPADSVPRIRLVRSESGTEVVLRAVHLVQGDAASMRVELAPLGRSPIWMIAGLSLSLLYLVRFRDLVASHPDAERSVS